MKTPSLDYEVIITDDGSETLFSKRYNEACHSRAGASLETKLHYLKACEVAEKLTAKEEVRILEVGFGTGLGFLETYELALELKMEHKLKFISLEIDPALVNRFFSEHEGKFPQLQVITGDARETIKEISGPFDCIYQDAFSPRRNPELWSVEWFRELARLSHRETILSTYSASSRIRKSMLECDWRLFPGAKFGPKRSATIAKRSGESDSDILAKLKLSPVGALFDCEVDEYRKLD